MMIHPLFTVHTLQAFHVFSNILDFIEAEWSIYQNVQYFIRSKNSAFNFTADRYSLHKCSETILCLKRQLTVHVSPIALDFIEARKTCHWVVRTSIWLIPYSEELSIKSCIVKTSDTLIIWSASCYTAGSDKSDARVEKGCRPTAKKWRTGLKAKILASVLASRHAVLGLGFGLGLEIPCFTVTELGEIKLLWTLTKHSFTAPSPHYIVRF